MTIYYLGQSQNSEDFEVSFSFPCGDINEPIEKNGISHICEHLIFRIKINGVELKDYIQKNGFYANAYTYHDATIFFIKCPKGRGKEAIDIFKRAFNICAKEFNVTQPIVEREKNVVKEELGLSNGGMLASHRLHGMLYKDTIYGGTIIGTTKTIDSITRSDIIRYYRKNYKEPVIVIKSGVKHTRSRLQTVPARSSIHISTKSTVAVNSDFGESISIAFPGYPGSNMVATNMCLFIAFALKIIANNEIREKRGHIYRSSIEYIPYAYTGALYVNISTTTSDAKTLFNTFTFALNNLKKTRIAEFKQFLKAYGNDKISNASRKATVESRGLDIIYGFEESMPTSFKLFQETIRCMFDYKKSCIVASTKTTKGVRELKGLLSA
jgi:hypothetical protein